MLRRITAIFFPLHVSGLTGPSSGGLNCTCGLWYSPPDFLDLSITRTHNKLTIDIYRKPMTTNTTINFMSNHPLEHKMAASRYHIERMHKLPLDPIKKQKEWEIIQAISESNNVPIKLLQKLYHQTPKRENQRTEQNENKKWTTFTYYSPKIRAVTNIFKNTNLRIAFKTTSTLRQLTRQRQQTPTPDHDRSGIYKIICKSCHKAYVGQTNRSLKTRH